MRLVALFGSIYTYMNAFLGHSFKVIRIHTAIARIIELHLLHCQRSYQPFFYSLIAGLYIYIYAIYICSRHGDLLFAILICIEEFLVGFPDVAIMSFRACLFQDIS